MYLDLRVAPSLISSVNKYSKFLTIGSFAIDIPVLEKKNDHCRHVDLGQVKMYERSLYFALFRMVKLVVTQKIELRVGTQ